MTLTSNYDIKPNLSINITTYYNEDKRYYYMVATSPDVKGLVTDGKTEDELIKNIIEVIEMYKEIGELKNIEHNIILNYNTTVINDKEL